MDQHLEITDKQPFQQQVQTGQIASKASKESFQTSQTDRYSAIQTQQRIMQGQQEEEECGVQEEKSEKIINSGQYNMQSASFNSSSSTAAATNQTIDNNHINSDKLRKQIPFSRPIPLKHIKRAESTNENFYTASQEKMLHTQGLVHMTKMNGTITHFGINGKLAKSNPLELLKSMQKESHPSKLQCALTQLQQPSLTPLQTTNLQQCSANFSTASHLALKQKKNNLEMYKKQLNKEQQNIERQCQSPKQDISIENVMKRQYTDKGSYKLNNNNNNNNNNSFQIEELPFKQKNLLAKNTSTQYYSTPFNQINQSPLVQQSQSQQQQQNQIKRNVTLSNFHQITQIQATSSPSNNLIQQQNTSPLKQSYLFSSNQLQSQSQPTILNGGSLSYPFGSITDNTGKSFKRNLCSHNSLPISGNSQSTASTSINSTPQTIKNDSSNKIAFRFSLKKTNCSNISAAFSSSQQPQQKSSQPEQQKQQDEPQKQLQSIQDQLAESQNQYGKSDEPFELPEQEEFSYNDDLGGQNSISPTSFNVQLLQKNEKSRSFYLQSNQFLTKCGSDQNTITSLNDIQNNLTSSITTNKLLSNQNQLKKKINDAMSKASYYSAHFEKQKLFEKQNEEEEANFRELCQVFSIM